MNNTLAPAFVRKFHQKLKNAFHLPLFSDHSIPASAAAAASSVTGAASVHSGNEIVAVANNQCPSNQRPTFLNRNASYANGLTINSYHSYYSTADGDVAETEFAEMNSCSSPCDIMVSSVSTQSSERPLLSTAVRQRAPQRLPLPMRSSDDCNESSNLFSYRDLMLFCDRVFLVVLSFCFIIGAIVVAYA